MSEWRMMVSGWAKRRLMLHCSWGNVQQWVFLETGGYKYSTACPWIVSAAPTQEDLMCELSLSPIICICIRADIHAIAIHAKDVNHAKTAVWWPWCNVLLSTTHHSWFKKECKLLNRRKQWLERDISTFYRDKICMRNVCILGWYHTSCDVVIMWSTWLISRHFNILTRILCDLNHTLCFMINHEWSHHILWRQCSKIKVHFAGYTCIVLLD